MGRAEGRSQGRKGRPLPAAAALLARLGSFGAGARDPTSLGRPRLLGTSRSRSRPRPRGRPRLWTRSQAPPARASGARRLRRDGSTPFSATRSPRPRGATSPRPSTAGSGRVKRGPHTPRWAAAPCRVPRLPVLGSSVALLEQGRGSRVSIGGSGPRWSGLAALVGRRNRGPWSSPIVGAPVPGAGALPVLDSSGTVGERRSPLCPEGVGVLFTRPLSRRATRGDAGPYLPGWWVP